MDVGTFLVSAKEAALQAGALLKENSSKTPEIRFKGAVDLVTDIDSRAQELIIERLGERFPGHDFLAEEDQNREGDSEYLWIIDPLDGTTNFAHNYPVFCVSIALIREGQVLLGVVFDPMRDELFTAVKGEGATANGRTIGVSCVRELDKSLLATGFPYDLRESRVNNISHFVNFVTRVQGIRRGGSAALDLCYVACGRFDGFWELKLQPWDVAAGGLVVLEAGGRVSDFCGGPFRLSGKETLATNGLIHQQMIDVLQKKIERNGKKE
jgi:myo-inositol-1(or 4)-monophosphatase